MSVRGMLQADDAALPGLNWEIVMTRRLTDTEYILEMVEQIRNLPSSPENQEHEFRLRKISWKLTTIDYVEQRLKVIRARKLDNNLPKRA